MKKSRRIVKKMSKKSLINKKALRYIIANSNLCKHAIRELELAGYSKEEDGPNKWMREQVIEAVALFSSHGNSGFSAPFEINLVKKLCSFDIISPLRFDDGEWGKIGLDGSCQNKRKSSIFKEPDGSIHDVDAFSKVPVKKFLFDTRTWTENIHKIGWIGGLFETMVESKAKSFVNELRKRYDMAFATFIVDNMRKQNMLKDDKIAELLKDNPNEK